MNKEKQYRQLQAESMERGKDKIDSILEYGGAALAIGASAASIAVAIHTLKK